VCQKLIIGTHAAEISEEKRTELEHEITACAGHAQHVYERADGIKCLSVDTIAGSVEEVKVALCTLASKNPLTKKEVSVRYEAVCIYRFLSPTAWYH
jgi:hypothetical protein